MKKQRDSRDDRIFYAVNAALLTLVMLVVLYPLIFIVSCSFSSAHAITSGRVILWPVDVTLRGYKAVFEYSTVLRGYLKTFFYTFSGTLINIALTMIAAYPLARPQLPGRKGLMLLFSFTMLFSGGMIPTYILVRGLGMINTVWAMIIPGALSVYNMIITRTFLQTNVPLELLEASQIDGCSDFRYFFSVVLPLSKAVIAVITLYYAVGHWNSYFSAFLYLSEQKLYPLQIVLRDILLANSFDASLIVDEELAAAKQGLADLLKYSLMVVSSLPVIIMYPFVQKYFIQGVLIGSIKG
ncbi:MAG: carbohydrate ABC transporter permease [Eubacteriales bacterium]|nr:carbohydrate ABC transporter permease [Eubacteriales bacterium]